MKKLLICLVLLFALVGLSLADNLRVKEKEYLTSSENKIAYAYRALEKLRLLHNEKGAEYKSGNLTEKEWNAFRYGEFEPKEKAIMDLILECRQEFKKSKTYDVDLENDFESK